MIDILTEELPVLRAKIGLSQEEVSLIVGISRQTYSAVETRKRKMAWTTFLTLVLYYEQNESTRPIIESIGVLTNELKEILKINRRE